MKKCHALFAAILMVLPGLAFAAPDCSDWQKDDFWSGTFMSALQAQDGDKFSVAQHARACLDAGADPNVRIEGGPTPLQMLLHISMFAASDDNMAADIADTVTALTEAGADPNTTSSIGGGNALHIAASTANAIIVNALIAAGTDIDMRNDNGYTPLHVAAERPPATATDAIAFGIVNALIKAGASTEMRDSDGLTPLHRAATFGTTGAVMALIEADADLEARDANGLTPLHWAASTLSAETNHALIEALAQSDERLAQDNEKTERRLETMRQRMVSGSEDKVNMLIEAGANIEAKNGDGLTPLHVAASAGHAQTVDALLDAGADAGARLPDARTAFDLAEEYNAKLMGTGAYWRLNDARFE